jgi:hypothetical protein
MRRPNPEITFHHFQVFTFGSDEEYVAVFGSVDNAERVWSTVRDEFLDRWNLWGMPEAWWRFEPEIPAELRSGPSMILSNADATKWNTIERARRQYLLTIGIDPTPPPRRAFGSSAVQD